MLKVIMYKCDVCGKCYESEKEAIDCEARDYAIDAQNLGRYKNIEESIDRGLYNQGFID